MALSFLPSRSHLVLGSLAELSGSTAMTVAAWVKLASASGDQTIAIRGTQFASTAPWLLWRDELGQLSGRVNMLAALVNTDAGTVRVEGTSNSLNDTQWHHVAMVFAAGAADGLKVYIDGTPDPNNASTVGHSTVVANTADVTIGIASLSQQLLADVGEVVVAAEALSEWEIAALAAGISPQTLPAARNRLLVHQPLVSGVNQWHLGSAASTSGSFSPAPHPRLLPHYHGAAFVSHQRPLLAGPYYASRGALSAEVAQAGSVFHAGAASGIISPDLEANDP